MMTDRRSFIAGLAVASIAVAAPASAAIAIPRVADPLWTALLANAERAKAAFDVTVDLHDAADTRFYEAKEAYMEQWQRAFDERSYVGRFIEAGPDDEHREERVQASIQKYNARNAEMRAERAEAEQRIREEIGMPDVARQYNEACDAYTGAIKAIIAYPSRDPEIIAEKLRLIMKEYGDDNGDLTLLLKSLA